MLFEYPRTIAIMFYACKHTNHHELKGEILMPSKNTVTETVELNNFKGEWMDLKTAAAYLNVSYKSIRTFQTMGLEIVEIGRIRRVSKTALDDFMHKHII